MSEQLALRAAAVAFTALYAVATFLPDLPEGAYADATVLGLVNDGPSRTAILVGGGALTLAGLLFLAWTAALAARLDRDGSWLSRAVLLGGAGYGLCLMLAATAFTGVATGIAVGELEPADDPYLVRLASDLGFHLLLVPGLLCASLAVAAASALGRRSGALPPAVTVVGAVVAPLLWAGPLWAPQFLVPLWMLTVALTLRPAAAGGPGSAMPSPASAAA
jgi:hypothetical protein